jgi:hypothetical protein
VVAILHLGGDLVAEEDIHRHDEVGWEGIGGDIVVVDMAWGLGMGEVILIVRDQDHEVRIGIQEEIGAEEGGDEVQVIAVSQVEVLPQHRGGEVGLGVEVHYLEGEIGVQVGVVVLPEIAVIISGKSNCSINYPRTGTTVLEINAKPPSLGSMPPVSDRFIRQRGNQGARVSRIRGPFGGFSDLRNY